MREQALLFRVEVECQKVGFTLNAKKTQDMAFNIKGDVRISTTDGSVLDVKEDLSVLTLGKVRMNSVHSRGRAKFRIVCLTYARSVRFKDIFLFRRHLKVLYS